MSAAASRQHCLQNSSLLVHGLVFGVTLACVGLAVLCWQLLRDRSAEELLADARKFYAQGADGESLLCISRGLQQTKEGQLKEDLQALRRDIIFRGKLSVIRKMVSRREYAAAKIQLEPLKEEAPEHPEVRFLWRAVEQALERNRSVDSNRPQQGQGHPAESL